MPYSTRKFAALLLAIWLPLFSGNALAASVTMLAMSDECPMMAAQINARSHHGYQATGQHESAMQQDGNDFACNDIGVCHFACSGYLATLALEMMKTLLSAQSYPTSATQFQSCTTTPLDPPPLSCV